MRIIPAVCFTLITVAAGYGVVTSRLTAANDIPDALADQTQDAGSQTTNTLAGVLLSSFPFVGDRYHSR
jgi:hypothetical protein